MRTILFIALRQLWDRRFLGGIAIGGVALGVTTLVAMNAIMQGFQMKFKGEILRVSPHVVLLDKKLGSNASILELLLPGPFAALIHREEPRDRITRVERPRDVVDALQAMPEVEAACPVLNGQALLSRGTQDLGVDVRGVHAALQDRCTPVSSYAAQGNFLSLASTADGIVIGQGVADGLGAHLGDRVRMVAPGGLSRSLRVVAILDVGIPAIDKVRAYVPLDVAQEVLRKPSIVSRIEVRLKDPWSAPAFTQRVEEMTGQDAESWIEQNANFLGLFDVQNVIVKLVVGAILVVGGFGILAIQVMIVLQKTRDIAILRSVGLRRKDILWCFLLQGLALSTVGAVLGDLAGWRLVLLLGTLKVKTEGLIKSSTFVVFEDPIFYVYGFVFALVIGAVASLLPAWRAARVEPVEVLRGQI